MANSEGPTREVEPVTLVREGMPVRKVAWWCVARIVIDRRAILLRGVPKRTGFWERFQRTNILREGFQSPRPATSTSLTDTEHELLLQLDDITMHYLRCNCRQNLVQRAARFICCLALLALLWSLTYPPRQLSLYLQPGLWRRLTLSPRQLVAPLTSIARGFLRLSAASLPAYPTDMKERISYPWGEH